ncbi:MAG: hypothetical protein AB8B64_09855 [Granulosicoccus sp.]
MRALSILAVLLMLTACSGGSAAPGVPMDDGAGQGDTCDTAYYRELRGDYEGQIEFSSRTAACAWNVDMQVSTRLQSTDMCFTFVSLTSNLTSSDFGDSTVCRDIGTSAQLYEPYLGELSLEVLDNPAWPVDGTLNLSTALEPDKVFPVGSTGQVQLITLRFNGLGNVTYPDSSDPDERFAGVLFRQMDQ